MHILQAPFPNAPPMLVYSVLWCSCTTVLALNKQPKRLHNVKQTTYCKILIFCNNKCTKLQGKDCDAKLDINLALTCLLCLYLCLLKLSFSILWPSEVLWVIHNCESGSEFHWLLFLHYCCSYYRPGGVCVYDLLTSRSTFAWLH